MNRTLFLAYSTACGWPCHSDCSYNRSQMQLSADADMSYLTKSVNQCRIWVCLCGKVWSIVKIKWSVDLGGRQMRLRDGWESLESSEQLDHCAFVCPCVRLCVRRSGEHLQRQDLATHKGWTDEEGSLLVCMYSQWLPPSLTRDWGLFFSLRQRCCFYKDLERTLSKHTQNYIIQRWSHI